MHFCPFSKSRCAPDPASPTTCTLAVSIAACDISDSYECFVLQILGDLLIDGANAPFYKSLLESGLGTSFAPATGELVLKFYLPPGQVMVGVVACSYCWR